jgi:hypothetical protein
MVYGDLKFCLVEVTAKPARHWGRRELGKWDFSPGGAWIGSWPRLIFSAVALILAKRAYWRIRRNGGVAA